MTNDQYTGIVASDEETTEAIDFTPCPVGNHPARFVQVIDNGTSEDVYEGELKVRHRVTIGWEVYPEDDDGNVIMNEAGEYYLVWEDWTLSLDDKAKMVERLTQLRGTGLSAIERRRFEVGSLLDQLCSINVTHETKMKDGEQRVYAKIASIAPLSKKLAASVPDRGHDIVFFNVHKPDMEVFATFSKWRQEQIQKSYEWNKNTPGYGAMDGEKTVSIVQCNKKSGSGRKGEWTNYRFLLDNDGVRYWASTFDDGVGQTLESLVDSGKAITITLARDGKYTNIVSAGSESSVVAAKSAPPAGGVWSGTVANYNTKRNSDGSERYGFQLSDGTSMFWASTFNEDMAAQIEPAVGTGEIVRLSLQKKGEFFNIVGVIQSPKATPVVADDEIPF